MPPRRMTLSLYVDTRLAERPVVPVDGTKTNAALLILQARSLAHAPRRRLIRGIVVCRPVMRMPAHQRSRHTSPLAVHR